MDLNELADVTDPSDFPLEILKKLDSAFRCTICKEFFEAPVSLTHCGHTFCSLCIRNQLPSKPECPLCKKAAKETQLTRNVMFGEAIEVWCRAREIVLRLAKDSTQSSTSHNGKKRKRGVERDSNRADYNESDFPSTSRRRLDDDHDPDIICIPSSSPEPEETGADTRSNRQTSEVICPLCSQQVLMSSINSHIDSGCKKYLATGEKVDKRTSKAAWNSIFKQEKRKMHDSPRDAEIPTTKLAKVSYGTLTLPGLKKLLSDFGLQTTGDKDALITRHERWLAIYNANLDRAHPKPLGELKVKLYEVEEAVNRPGPKKISDEKDWAKKNRDQFKSLIAQAKNGKPPEKDHRDNYHRLDQSKLEEPEGASS